MIKTLMKAPGPRLVRESVVTLATEPISIHGPDADLPGSRRLGPGFVREVAPCGHIGVHWLEREFDSWMDRADLAVLPADARVISVFHCAATGHRQFERHKVVSSQGLLHNWIVELLPDAVVRTERSDGAAWTFRWMPILQRVELIHTMDQIPPEEADAEALTVAGLAFA